MTVAVALTVGDRIVVGADSRVTDDTGTVCGQLYKIAQLGTATLTYSGSVSHIQRALRRAYSSEPTVPEEFVDCLAGCKESTWLWVQDGLIWNIDGDGAVYYAGEAAGTGSGSPHALGYLAGKGSTKSASTARSWILSALEYAASVDLGCGPPFNVVIV